MGVAQAIEVPALFSFIGQTAGPTRIANVVALNVLVWNCARVVGPGLAGWIIAAFGATVVFALNAISYLPLIAGMLVIRARPGRTVRASTSDRRGVGDAIEFVRQDRRVGLILALLAINTVCATSYIVLAPAISDELGAGPSGVGALLSAAGAGAVIAAIFLAATSERRRRVLVLGTAGALVGLGQLGMAASHDLILSMGLMAVAGGGMVAFTATSNAVIQTLTPDALRGRLMSFYAIVIPGMFPLGSLAAGAVGETFSVPVALATGSLAWLTVLTLALVRSSALRSL